MTNNISRCPHVATIGLIEKEDYLNAIQVCFRNKINKLIYIYSFFFPSLKNAQNVIVLVLIYGYV